MTKRCSFVAGLFVASLLGLTAAPVCAEVRFGRNVFVGGHDFSHQRFDRRHRAEVYLYGRRPRNAGCQTHADGRGGRVKECHLRMLHRH